MSRLARLKQWLRQLTCWSHYWGEWTTTEGMILVCNERICVFCGYKDVQLTLKEE